MLDKTREEQLQLWSALARKVRRYLRRRARREENQVSLLDSSEREPALEWALGRKEAEQLGLSGCDIQGLCDDMGRRGVDYINVGDPYETTLYVFGDGTNCYVRVLYVVPWADEGEGDLWQQFLDTGAVPPDEVDRDLRAAGKLIDPHDTDDDDYEG